MFQEKYGIARFLNQINFTAVEQLQMLMMGTNYVGETKHTYIFFKNYSRQRANE